MLWNRRMYVTFICFRTNNWLLSVACAQRFTYKAKCDVIAVSEFSRYRKMRIIYRIAFYREKKPSSKISCTLTTHSKSTTILPYQYFLSIYVLCTQWHINLNGKL